MGTGYTRQSSSEIQTGEDILAAPLNAEFNQLQSAFDSSTGHSHDGTSGEGPLINLTSSITGLLPVANGGIAGINNITATTAPTSTDDTGSDYAVGSLWVDVTADISYICVDATSSNAIWQTVGQNGGLDDIAGLTPTNSNFIVGDGANWVAETGATARTSLGLAIGTDVQAYDATLASLSALGTAADKVAYTTGTDTWAEADITSFGRSLIDDASASAGRTTLGVAIGSDVQAHDDILDDLSGLSQATDKLPYFSSGSAMATADFTSFGRSLVDDASASAARTTLGVAIGSDVQAHDAILDDMAGLTQASNKLPYFSSSSAMSTTTFSSFARTLVDDSSASAMRTTLDVDQAGTDNSTPAGSDSDIQYNDGGAWGATDLHWSANTLEQYNGSTGQNAYFYNTRTDASNYERIVVGFDTNEAWFGTEEAGTGTARNIKIRRGGFDVAAFYGGSFQIYSDVYTSTGQDGNYDIGTLTGPARFGNIHLSSAVTFGDESSRPVTPATGVHQLWWRTSDNAPMATDESGDDYDLTGSMFSGTKTISSGAITITRSGLYQIEGEGAAADDLTDISGGSAGMFLVLMWGTGADAITVKDNNGTGSSNIVRSGGDKNLNATDKAVTLIHNGTEWVCIEN